MARFALIKRSTRRVVNVIEAQASFAPGAGFIKVRSDVAKLGDRYRATTNDFVTPAPRRKRPEEMVVDHVLLRALKRKGLLVDADFD